MKKERTSVGITLATWRRLDNLKYKLRERSMETLLNRLINSYELDESLGIADLGLKKND